MSQVSTWTLDKMKNDEKADHIPWLKTHCVTWWLRTHCVTWWLWTHCVTWWLRTHCVTWWLRTDWDLTTWAASQANKSVVRCADLFQSDEMTSWFVICRGCDGSSSTSWCCQVCKWFIFVNGEIYIKLVLLVIYLAPFLYVPVRLTVCSQSVESCWLDHNEAQV